VKTTTADLERRVAALPLDFEKYVGKIHGGKVKVKSFSSSAVYDVAIRRGEKEGDLEATCTCPATRVCHHITSFFAVAKGLAPDTGEPDEGKETTPEPIEEPRDGLKLIAEAIEKLVDGVALVVSERMKEE